MNEYLISIISSLIIFPTIYFCWVTDKIKNKNNAEKIMKKRIVNGKNIK